MDQTNVTAVIDFDAKVNQNSNTNEISETLPPINTNAIENSVSNDKSNSNYHNEALAGTAFAVLKNSSSICNAKDVLSPIRTITKKRKVKANSENLPNKIIKSSDKKLNDFLKNTNMDNASRINAQTINNTQTINNSQTINNTQTINNSINAVNLDKERIKQLESELDEKDENMEKYQIKVQEVLKKILIENSKFERKEKRFIAENNKLEIGYYENSRNGVHYEQKNILGRKFKKIEEERKRIEEQLKENERQKKELKKFIPTGDKGKAIRFKAMPQLDLKEYQLRSERIEINKRNLNKEEKDLDLEYEILTRSRNAHLRELRRIDNEDNSRFKDYVLMNDRYVLLSLLGKGGFSEVYKAFDLVDMMYVACKIHQLNSNWSSEKKESYIKHGLREISIHKSLDHNHIVRSYHVFNHDCDTFVMVLEYCEGNDLDFYLKQNKCLPERDAKQLINEVISSVFYLNTRKRPIIHFDLKPANILLCNNGGVKITDFGLSKIITENDNHPDEIELTSQGAGTYWYLPPECFVTDEGGTKIDLTLDVWSIGVIFYQCLFGIKPFGNDESQTDIINNNTITKAKSINFPQYPKVSDAAKELIKKCLTYIRQERPNIYQLAADDYLKSKTN